MKNVINVTVTPVKLPARFDGSRKVLIPAKVMYRAVSGRYTSLREDRTSAISDVVRIVRYENAVTSISA